MTYRPDLERSIRGEPGAKDFFISFNRADAAWAEWIAYVLEDNGYSVVFQHWDMRPGSNFVIEMDKAVNFTEKTFLVLSDAALESKHVRAEWAAAYNADPTGEKRKLIPVRVKPLTVPRGLLGQIVYVDLLGLGEEDATSAILGALAERRGSGATRSPSAAGREHARPPFPGEVIAKETVRLKERLEETLKGAAENGGQPATRNSLEERLSNLASRYFNILVEVLGPPPGYVKPMPWNQEQRIAQLLDWVTGSDGHDLKVVSSLLGEIEKEDSTRVPLDQVMPDRLAERAIESCEGNLDDLRQLGDAYIETGQWAKAFLTYCVFVEIAAESATEKYAAGLERLGEIHRRYGDLKSAELLWEQSRSVFKYRDEVDQVRSLDKRLADLRDQHNRSAPA